MASITEIFKEAKEDKSPPKPQNGQVSDLYIACRNGDIEAVRKILVDTKCDTLNIVEPNGSTALHAASYYGHTEIVRLLLQQPNIMLQQQNIHGLTAFQEATKAEIRQLFDKNPGKRFWNTPKNS